MTPRRWMLVLGVSSALMLAVGLPVLAMSTSTVVVTGPVASVDPVARIIVLHDVTGPRSTKGQDVAVHLPQQLITSDGGSESLDALVPGQQVQARISRHADHLARWARLRS